LIVDASKVALKETSKGILGRILTGKIDTDYNNGLKKVLLNVQCRNI